MHVYRVRAWVDGPVMNKGINCSVDFINRFREGVRGQCEHRMLSVPHSSVRMPEVSMVPARLSWEQLLLVFNHLLPRAAGSQLTCFHSRAHDRSTAPKDTKPFEGVELGQLKGNILLRVSAGGWGVLQQDQQVCFCDGVEVLGAFCSLQFCLSLSAEQGEHSNF